jgi:two-component system OmpR family sensor kinase
VRTGSLRKRVTSATLVLLAIMLTGVIAAVTIAYRSNRERDLIEQLRAAGDEFDDALPGDVTKFFVADLARHGIAVDFGDTSATVPDAKSGSSDPTGVKPYPPPVKAAGTISAQGSLVVLDQQLPDGTYVVLSASSDAIAADVQQLLTIEIAVALVALVLAALLIRRVTSVALKPLADVSRTATRIAAGDTAERLRPARSDTELGSMAAAFDHMVDALEEAVRQAKGAEETMGRFLADASHELRTPIAALQATAERLLRDQPRRPRRDALEAMLAGDAARLGRLVDDLLSLTRLDATLPAPSTSVDLAHLAEAAVAEIDRRGPVSAIALELASPVWVAGDPEALSRVIRNLLDNAVTAAGSGGQVRLRVAETANEARLNVEDDGPGVPAEERERIFGRFVRLTPGTSNGSGLGLAIARRIARQHRGDLTCDEVHRGARFTLRLPLAEPVEPIEPHQAPESVDDHGVSGAA